MKNKKSFNKEVMDSLRRAESLLYGGSIKNKIDHNKLHQRHTKAGVVWVQLCDVCQQELKVFEKGRKLYGFYN